MSLETIAGLFLFILFLFVASIVFSIIVIIYKKSHGGTMDQDYGRGYGRSNNSDSEDYYKYSKLKRRYDESKINWEEKKEDESIYDQIYEKDDFQTKYPIYNPDNDRWVEDCLDHM